MLYFFDGHRIKEIDIRNCQKLTKYTNVIPVLAKADQFTPRELATVKDQLLAMAALQQFEFFDVESTIEEQSRLAGEVNGVKLRTPLLPFAIINPNEIRETETTRGKVLQLGRQYEWGFASSMDPQISDFKLLFSVLTHLSSQELRSTAE